MRIAVLSDIHGNCYALEQVLTEAASLRVEKLLVLGDIVGYYYHPDKVMKQLSSWNYEFVRGNHEVILSQLSCGTIDSASIQKKYGSGHRLAMEKLTSEQITLLTQAPDKHLFQADGYSVLLCHGAPWDPDFYLYPDTPHQVLDQCSAEKVDFVFVGHSHYPFIYKASRTMLVNTGSVGQSRSWGGQANWALLDTANGSLQMRSTPYDPSALLQEIEKIDPENGYLSKILKRKPFEK